MPQNDRHRHGFTLIEVLVALGLCGVVLGAILPAVALSGSQARKAEARLALDASEPAISPVSRPGSGQGPSVTSSGAPRSRRSAPGRSARATSRAI